jgi:hypothetical protein
MKNRICRVAILAAAIMAPILALFLSCAPAAVITDWQIGTTQCGPAWLGCSALNDWDTAETHTLLSNMQPSYVNFGMHYSNFSTGDWSRTDAQMNLNRGWKIIVEIDGTTSNTVSNAVALIIGRYTNDIYAVYAGDEWTDDSPSGITNYSRYVNQVRGAIDGSGWRANVRLAGPGRQNSDIAPFMVAITNLINGITNLDLIVAHDYYAVPGNGSPPGTNTFYYHVTQPAYFGTTLAQRLVEMNRWQTLTGHTNMPVMSEYGLYDSDVQDAIDAARAFKTNHCAVILHVPNAPVHSVLPLGHQLPGPLWDKPMSEFLREACK